MRFVIGVVLALSVGIGAYLGSAQVADSAKTPPRRVTLRFGDIAAIGQIQCVATTDSRSQHPGTRDAFMWCSKGPVSHAAGSVEVRPGGLIVLKKVGQAQCVFDAPLGASSARGGHLIISDLLCSREGPRKHIRVSVKVLPGVPGGIAVLKKGKMVYRTGWDPR
ncbi:MAG TPA: hypothetical protein VFM43_06495 [Gaiellaceae bacterium]|nr:hypothetical protein [Gaiellaceae bacterium]